LISVSAVLVVACQRLRVPSIILNIFAGLILGPVLNVVDLGSVFAPEESHGAEEAIAIVSETGIALLLFLVGLELSLTRVRDVGKVAVAAGLGQVVFTAGIGFALALAMGFETTEAFFVATALTFSSTVVVVKLLDQKGDLQALYGRIAVGIFLVQDLVVIVALTVLAGLAAAEGESGGGGDIAGMLGLAFLGMSALLVTALVAAKWILPRPFAWASRSPEMLFVWSLCLCFVFVLAAEKMRLSPEIGAFLAGVSLAQLRCSHDLIRRVRPVMNFFVAVFFVTLGAQMNLSLAADVWPQALGLSLFVLIGNPVIFLIIIARFGYSERTAFQTSVTVAQISEFSFIFIAMGLSAGLVSESVLSLVALVGIATIAISAYMIMYSDALYRWVKRTGVLRVFRASQEEDDAREVGRRGHIVIVGMNTLGRSLVERLHERGEDVLAVDTDVAKLAGLPGRSMVGNVDYLPVVEEAGVPEARLVISCLRIENANNLLAWRCEEYGMPCAIHAFDRSVQAALHALDVAYLINSKEAGRALIVSRLEPIVRAS